MESFGDPCMGHFEGGMNGGRFFPSVAGSLGRRVVRESYKVGEEASSF